MSSGHLEGARYYGLVIAAAVLALLASLGLMLAFALSWGGASMGGGEPVSPDGTGNGTQTPESERRNPLTVGNILFFAVPIVIAAVPVFIRRRRLAIVARAIAAGLLFLWVLFLAFGGGLFYLPSAGLMAVAAILGTTPTTRERRPPISPTRQPTTDPWKPPAGGSG